MTSNMVDPISVEEVQAAEARCDELVDGAVLPPGEVWGSIYRMLAPAKARASASDDERWRTRQRQRHAYTIVNRIVNVKLANIVAVSGPCATMYLGRIDYNKKALVARAAIYEYERGKTAQEREELRAQKAARKVERENNRLREESERLCKESARDRASMGHLPSQGNGA